MKIKIDSIGDLYIKRKGTYINQMCLHHRYNCSHHCPQFKIGKNKDQVWLEICQGNHHIIDELIDEREMGNE